VAVWRSRIEEIRAEINERLTGILNEQEYADTRRFGEINEALETGQAAPAADLEPEPRKDESLEDAQPEK